MASHTPYLRLPRYNYNEANIELRIIADVVVDLDANEDIQVQDPIQINLVTYYVDLFVFTSPGFSPRNWNQEIAIPIRHGQIYDPAVVTVLAVKKAMVREKIKEMLGNFGSNYFTVITNVTQTAPTNGNTAKGVIGSGDDISIN
jgi:hypothetical protein